jgi:hypothetical protein
MILLSKCIHVSNEYEFGRKDVILESFQYVTYEGRERKNIQLVTSKVRFCDFMKDFTEKTQHYVHHVHVAHW